MLYRLRFTSNWESVSSCHFMPEKFGHTFSFRWIGNFILVLYLVISHKLYPKVTHLASPAWNLLLCLCAIYKSSHTIMAGTYTSHSFISLLLQLLNLFKWEHHNYMHCCWTTCLTLITLKQTEPTVKVCWWHLGWTGHSMPSPLGVPDHVKTCLRFSQRLPRS